MLKDYDLNFSVFVISCLCIIILFISVIIATTIWIWDRIILITSQTFHLRAPDRLREQTQPQVLYLVNFDMLFIFINIYVNPKKILNRPFKKELCIGNLAHSSYDLIPSIFFAFLFEEELRKVMFSVKFWNKKLFSFKPY